MTYSEATQLLETWKEETYRVHGAPQCLAIMTGAMLSMMNLLLCDEYATEMTRELCIKKITEAINKLKNEKAAD